MRRISHHMSEQRFTWKEAFEDSYNAARAGSPRAQNFVGYCYDIGKGARRDKKMSRYWYEKAARKGNIDAIFNLALDDVRRNPARARRLYQQAALRGDLYSQTNLAVMLLDGEGGKTDTAAGFRWMRKAAQRGDDKAQYNLGRAYT